MIKVDQNTNFPLLILILAMLLLATTEGGRITELVKFRQGGIERVLFSLLFIFGSMLVIAAALMAPQYQKHMGLIAITLGLAKLAIEIVSIFVLDIPVYEVVGEGIGAGLIAVAGLFFIYGSE